MLTATEQKKQTVVNTGFIKSVTFRRIVKKTGLRNCQNISIRPTISRKTMTTAINKKSGLDNPASLDYTRKTRIIDVSKNN